MTIRAAMKKRLVLALAVPLWIAAPVAGFCGEKPAAPGNVEDPAVHGTVGGTCRTIAAIVGVYPALEVRTTDDPVPAVQGGSGSVAGCGVLASGSASAVAGEVLPEDAVRELLQQDGWKEDPGYAADGPGTASFALRKGGTLCFVSAGIPSAIEDGAIVTDDTYRFDAHCAAE